MESQRSCMDCLNGQSIRSGPASFQVISTNRKLSPIVYTKLGDTRWSRPYSLRPRVCSTYVSVSATCSGSCPFKDRGCYVQAGITGRLIRQLDAAAFGMCSLDVIREECALIDSVFPSGVPQDGFVGGRDLRLHVGGDASTERGAEMLARSADLWQRRGGGSVWTYTHAWRQIDRRAWGVISASASVETVEEADDAWFSGYVPVLVLPRFERAGAYRLGGSSTGLRLIPCSAELRGSNCAECRACIDSAHMRGRYAIGIVVHGQWRKIAAEGLRRVG